MTWPWPGTKPPELSPEPPRSTTLSQKLKDDLTTCALPTDLLALSTGTAFLLGLVTSAGAIGIYRRFWRRIPNADWVTPDYLARKRWIKGYVTNVGDADNFRLYHQPGLWWGVRTVPSTREGLKNQTIHIRLAGIDAPEAAHFGKPAQAFAKESITWLKNRIEGRTLYCQMCRKDQYGRIVAFVHVKPHLLPSFLAKGKCVQIEMLRAGWAETYEQAGAEHGEWGLEEFLRLQREAQRARRGIWKYGIVRESAAEYKKRYASGDATTSSGPVMVKRNGSASAGQPSGDEKSGWFRGFLRWAWR